MRWMIAVVVLVCGMARADVPPVPNGASAKVLILSDGGRIVGDSVPWPYPGGKGYAQGAWKLKADGTLDRGFNATGFVAVPYWGFYEGVGAFVETSQGRILVLGGATDPLHPSLGDPACHPSVCGVHVTLARLLRDGSIDVEFGQSGRAVFAIDGDRSISRIGLSGDRIELFEADARVAVLSASGVFDPTVPSIIRPIPYFDVGALWHASIGGVSRLGLVVSQRIDGLFATLQWIDSAGVPRWRVMPEARRTWKEGALAFAGAVYETRGVGNGGFPITGPVASPAGSAEIVFREASRGEVTTIIDGVSTSIAIERRARAPSTCGWQTGYSDANINGLWSSTEKAGTAVFAVQRDRDALLTWFTYDVVGRPTWYEGDLENIYGDYQGPLSGAGVVMGTMYIEPYQSDRWYFQYMFGTFFDRDYGSWYLNRFPGDEPTPRPCR